MTALCAGRHRAGRARATAATGRVRVVFHVLRGELGRAPSVAEACDRLWREGVRLRVEAVRVHLGLAGLRAGEGPP